MKVWVILGDPDYAPSDPVGVYSSYENAVEAAKQKRPDILKWKLDEDGITEDRIPPKPLTRMSDCLESFIFVTYDVDITNSLRLRKIIAEAGRMGSDE